MKVLLYAPELTGHPQVYCRVIGDALIQQGHSIVLAAVADEASWHVDWPDLRPFRNRTAVTFVDIRRFSATGETTLTAEELVNLQRCQAIDSTLLVEGDYFQKQFRRIAGGLAPPLRGRNCGIFAYTNQWYPGEDKYSGERIPFCASTLRETLGNLKRAIFDRKDSDHYFYEHVLLRGKVIDAVIVKDERITERYGPPVHWMPEIYRVFEDAELEPASGASDPLTEKIQSYISQAGAQNVLLYFGTGAWYKGYDYFLKLAELDETTFALHAGAPQRIESKTYAFDTQALRASLLRQGRLFETNAFAEGPRLINLLFSSIERFVSTHRLTGSSGTMLQALEADKPVLVPENGLMGLRTARHDLGLTYGNLDIHDLVNKWQAFRLLPPQEFKPAIDAFMKRFSKSEVSRFFCQVLCGG